MEIPNILNENSTRFTGKFPRSRKKVPTDVISTPKSFQPNKLCYFSSMDLKGSELS
jgi:hypothetical protein